MSLLSCDVHDLRAYSPQQCADLHQEVFNRSAWSPQSFAEIFALSSVFGEGISNFSGALLGFYIGQQAEDESELLTLLIHPIYQRQGYGFFLLQRLLTYVRNKNINSIFLEVSEKNQNAILLYQKAGFLVIGKRHSYYRNAKHNGENALTFRLSF